MINKGFLSILVLVVVVTVSMIYFSIALSSKRAESGEMTEVTAPAPPVRVTVDINNGFICYDNDAGIACYPLMWGVPPPEASSYIQGRIGHVFSFITTPAPIPPTPPPSFLDGIN